MKKSITIFITSLLNIIASSAQIFSVDTITIVSDNPIISTTYYNNSLYLLDNKSNVLDDNTEVIVANTNLSYISNIDNRLIGYEHLFKPYKYNTYREYYLSGGKFKKKGTVDKRHNKLFEDGRFIISSTCSGEWGGTIYFEDKTTNKKYDATATCPIVVNKINNTYFLSVGLCHGICMSSVLKIDNPLELTPYKKRKGKYISDLESIATEGYVVLADATLELITSFVFRNELYHIIVQNPNELTGYNYTTGIYKIIDGEFKQIQRLFDKEVGRDVFAKEIYYKGIMYLAIRVEEQSEPSLMKIDEDKITFYNVSR